jgi:hypothetical protein
MIKYPEVIFRVFLSLVRLMPGCELTNARDATCLTNFRNRLKDSTNKTMRESSGLFTVSERRQV